MQTILKVRNNIFLLKRQILFIDKVGVRHTTNSRENRKKQQKNAPYIGGTPNKQTHCLYKGFKRF